LTNWMWCSANSWSSRSCLYLHCLFGPNHDCLLASILTSISFPLLDLWLCLKKMKRYHSRIHEVLH
jgi:hypothetical protein